MKTHLLWRSGIHFSAFANNGTVLQIDGPPEIGGQDLGVRPMELMLMGIGGCTAVDVMHILRKARCGVTSCRTVITAERADSDPKVFTRIHLSFLLSGSNLSENRVDRAIELSTTKYCSASIMMQRAGVEVSHEWAIEPWHGTSTEDADFEPSDHVSTLGLHHVAQISKQNEASRRFYSEYMGLEIEWEPDEDNVYLTSGSDNLAIHRHQDSDTPQNTKLDHIGFVVAKHEHVDSWFEFLSSRNVQVEGKPKTHRDGARSFYALDPDGIRVQVIHHPPLVRALTNND